jgi:phage host-nuclease inhibitor protein Gam
MGVTMNNIERIIESKIVELAEVEGKIQAMNRVAESTIAKIQQKVTKDTQPFVTQSESLQKELYELATSHKELFDEKRLITTSHGEVGFHKSPPSLLVDMEIEKTIAKLKKMGRNDCVIVKESLNKNIIKKDSKVMKAIKARLDSEDKFVLKVTPIQPEKLKFKVS